MRKKWNYRIFVKYHKFKKKEAPIRIINRCLSAPTFKGIKSIKCNMIQL